MLADYACAQANVNTSVAKVVMIAILLQEHRLRKRLALFFFLLPRGAKGGVYLKKSEDITLRFLFSYPPH